MQPRTREILNAVLIGGLIAGAIDIGAASLISGRNPAYIMQVIAGGLFGRPTFDGGMATVILGAALQEFMGVLIATVYALSLKSASGLLRRWIPSGLAYGVVIFFVMNYVVLPLSAWKSVPHFTAFKFAANLAAMLLFGLIVAFFCRRLGMRSEMTQDQAASPA